MGAGPVNQKLPMPLRGEPASVPSKFKTMSKDFCDGSVVNILFPVQGVRVQS